MDILSFDILAQHSKISHFITTRAGGVSEGLYKSLNLSLKAGDIADSVILNRSILADHLGINLENLHFPDQCHTAEVKIINKADNSCDLTGTDGLITDKAQICLCVLAADCVPLLLFDPVKNIVAAVHAGWKGTVKRIISNTVEKMKSRYGSDPADILAGIGPAISIENYEVGDEVAAEFEDLQRKTKDIIQRDSVTQRAHIDLQEANRILLLESGLSENHIEVQALCTYSNPELFFSARRDGYHCGRFAAGIFLK